MRRLLQAAVLCVLAALVGTPGALAAPAPSAVATGVVGCAPAPPGVASPPTGSDEATSPVAGEVAAEPTCVSPAAPTVDKAPPCVAEGSMTIPDIEGVVYRLGHEVLESGRTYWGPGDATVRAEALPGYVLVGTSQWDVVLSEVCVRQPAVAPVPESATPAHDATAMAPAEKVTAPAPVTKVPATAPATKVPAAAPATKVRAAARATKVPAVAPAKDVTPVAPTVQKAEPCVAEGSMTIPEVEGVVYWLGDEVLEAGRTYWGPGDATIRAEALPGYRLVGTSEWDVVLSEVCVKEPTDQDIQGTPVALAQTGADPAVMVLAGAGLVSLGGALLRLSRTRAVIARD